MKETNLCKFGYISNIRESVYYIDEYGDKCFDPSKDAKYKYLLRKPINKLTRDEIFYIFAIYKATHVDVYWQSKYKDFDELCVKSIEDEWGDCINDAYSFFSKLKFPLKVYRALRDDEDINNISGKQFSHSWTTDINVYKADNSMFNHCTKIVEAEITADMIQNEHTISNYMYYSAEHYNSSLGIGKQYPENEITLKSKFKNAKLMNLKYIDKNQLQD